MRAKILVGTSGLLPAICSASELHGAALSMWWGLPLIGLLFSIALCPLFMPVFWHHHCGKIAAAWAAAFLLPCAVLIGPDVALAGTVHAVVLEFLPFIILGGALFVVAGGIYVKGNMHGSPALNTGLLAMGTLLASIMGTTGASMLMIRPLIRANDNRKHAAHTIVFFIFLVANAGGSLTPLGDPPLFLGFLKGIDFSWTLKTIYPQTIFLCVALLLIFFALDSHFYHNREEEFASSQDPTPDSRIQLEGKANFILIGVIISLVLMSGMWKSGVTFKLLGAEISLQNMIRDVALIAIIFVSLWITPKSARNGNEFTWGPMLEVFKLFLGIFIAIIPVIAMLRAGSAGAFAPILTMVTDSSGQPLNHMYFWATGILSAFLDNAPTYLVFFNAAGSDPKALMTTLSGTLAAISCGAVFMGAYSYIGNAPNMMVKAIAEERGIKMPSFFGYMGWSFVVLTPLFIAMNFLFF